MAIAGAVIVGLPHLVKPHWEQLVGMFSEDEKNQFALSIATATMGMLVVANSFFALAYNGLLPCMKRYKVHPDRWPWEVPSKRAAFFKQLWKAIALTAFNNIALALPAAFGNYPVAVKLGFSTSTASFPSPLTLLWQLFAFMVVEDALFYTSHCTLHAFPFLYKHIHKVHHTWHYSIGISAEYAHPIEFLLGNALPFSAGPLLLGAHLFTWWAWAFVRIWHTVEGHSGYDIPWSPFKLLPWGGVATEHDVHHSINTGNFGSFFAYLDRWMGTEIPADKVAKWAERRAAADRELQAREAAGDREALGLVDAEGEGEEGGQSSPNGTGTGKAKAKPE